MPSPSLKVTKKSSVIFFKSNESPGNGANLLI